jgi:single-strand DNA-binding protein
MYLNRVTLIGYLARDPEFPKRPDGASAVLTLVTKRSWKDAKGTWQSRSDFHRCVAWGAALTDVAKTLAKGSPCPDRRRTPVA